MTAWAQVRAFVLCTHTGGHDKEQVGCFLDRLARDRSAAFEIAVS